jgi:2-polyprenyl-3-methyl-5-hydroxy-6-metoxy-1,4-benzoquinol methylase
MKCPLCSASSGQQVRDEISTSALSARYKAKYQTDIRHLIQTPTVQLIHCAACDLLYYQPLASGDEGFYNSLQVQPWYYVDEKPEFHRAASLIPEGAKVLETGSGKGNFARFLKKVDYTGLDFSTKAKELAAKNGVSIVNESVQTHSDKMPETYDVACSFQVLEHVEDIRGFLEAQVKCLKPGGILIIGVPSEDSYVARSFDLILNMPPHHLSRWTDTCLMNCGSLLNLKPIGLWHDTLQPHHYFDYCYSLSIHALKKWLGIPYKSLDTGIFHTLLKAPAYVLGKILAKGLMPGNLPYGHTVVAAFQKPMA